jgi:hypothetical protein
MKETVYKTVEMKDSTYQCKSIMISTIVFHLSRANNFLCINY